MPGFLYRGIALVVACTALVGMAQTTKPTGDVSDPIAATIRQAEQGDAKEQFALGEMYRTGEGLSQDEKLAVEWYRKSAEQGNAYAQFNLGVMYATGRGVAKDEKLAVEWYRKSAEQGDASAQFNLGWMYQVGRGIAQDEKLAVEWYRKSAEQGNASAQYDLGRSHANGRGVARDQVEATKWYRKAKEQREKDAPAQAEAILNLTEENAEKQFELGEAYAEGQGARRDMKLAVEWYRKAAKQGHAMAMFKMGEAYAMGEGVKRSETVALDFYYNAGVSFLKEGRREYALKCYDGMDVWNLSYVTGGVALRQKLHNQIYSEESPVRQSGGQSPRK